MSTKRGTDQAAVIEGGVNDIIDGVSKSTFLANWTAMLSAAQASSDIISAFVLKILPWTNGTNTQMQTRDDWNASLVTLAASYSKAVVIDTSNYVGQNREDGDAGNLWDIKTAHSADGINYNAIGYGQAALAIADSIDITVPTITNITSANDSGSYAAGQTIHLDINFSEVVTAADSVALILNTAPAESCTFTVSNSATSSCNYVVQAGDNVAVLDVTGVSGTIADLVGNEMADSVPVANLSVSKTISIDTAVPTISELSNETALRKTKTWTWRGEAGDTFRYAIDQNSTWTPIGTYGSTEIATQSGGNGTYYLHVQSKDVAGNESAVFTVSAVLYNPEPVPGQAQTAVQINQGKMISQIQYLKTEIARIKKFLQLKNGAVANAVTPANISYACNGIIKNLSYGIIDDPQVRCLQEFLKGQEAGIYPEAKVTGNFFGTTKAAVIRFQEKYRDEILKPFGLGNGTGFVGQGTRKAISRMLAGQTIPAK